MTAEATTLPPVTVEPGTNDVRQGGLRGRIELASSQLLVGTTVISARYIVDAFPVFVGMAVRQGVATLFMLIIFRVFQLKLPKLSRREHGIILLQTIMGVVLFNVLLMLGVDRTTAAASGVITATLPAMIAILSIALGERISRVTAYGILLAIVGLIVVNLPGADASSDRATAPVLGGILVVIAVLCEALFTILGKSLVKKVTPFQNCLLLCLYGTAMFIPLAIWQLDDFSFAAVPVSGWLAILWSAGPVMVGATSLWFGGLKFIPASAAAVYTGLLPVSAVLLSFALLGESIGWQHVLGMVLVILAVVLVARPRRMPPLAQVT